MRLLIQKVDVMANAVDLIGDRTTALEGAVADVSQSGIEVDSSTERGLTSAATMVAASADRRERVPDHDPSGDETLEDRDSEGHAATANGTAATASPQGRGCVLR